jgi:hypothetical protein
MKIDDVDVEKMSQQVSKRINLSVGTIEDAFYEQEKNNRLRQKLKGANTFIELQSLASETYVGLTKTKTVHQEVLRKWLEKAETIVQFRAIYRLTPGESSPGASEILTALLRKWLKKAKTYNEVEQVYSLTNDGSEVRNEAIIKLATFYKKR